MPREGHLLVKRLSEEDTSARQVLGLLLGRAYYVVTTGTNHPTVGAAGQMKSPRAAGLGASLAPATHGRF